ncbi:MAG TPA: glycosyltransferase family 87 protein [Bacteroidales bacterium]|nr:glycosyltransferase family 87 protein [Bacteroidales bacterium]HOX77494.1 glycosyltransferase family 87 protein [Bacteroidales bacterium]HPM93290.1 glycosyltransferase family 87 protein [Bacteroidales bacterium]
MGQHLIDKIRRNRGMAIYAVLATYAVLAAFIITFFNGTGDSGDSIHHYLFARYAPQHIELFFDHWAKPLFVLLASPFAQFGFTGMKIFNALAGLFTIWFTYRTVQLLNLRNPLLVTLLLIFAPMYFVQTFSGLTEPLFALFISIGLYFVVREKFVLSFLIISFLPFIRSEGLILIGVFALYAIVKNQWRPLPWLLTGHILYSVAGFFVHGDLLWVFTRIPYARLASTYGSGTIFHFAEKLNYVIGIPIFILFWAGVLSIILKLVRRQISKEIFILVFLGFLSYFIAHSLFWYFGIFNSMGLQRVLIGVMPMIAIISLTGFNFLTEELARNHRVTRKISQIALMSYILIFPFLSNPAAIKWDTDLSLAEDQVAATGVKEFIISHYSITTPRLIYSHPYLSEALQVDHFDQEKRLDLNKENLSRLRPGDLIIWENWFAVVENGISKESLEQNPDLINIFNTTNNKGKREIQFIIFKKN